MGEPVCCAPARSGESPAAAAAASAAAACLRTSRGGESQCDLGVGELSRERGGESGELPPSGRADGVDGARRALTRGRDFVGDDERGGMPGLMALVGVLGSGRAGGADLGRDLMTGFLGRGRRLASVDMTNMVRARAAERAGRCEVCWTAARASPNARETCWRPNARRGPVASGVLQPLEALVVWHPRRRSGARLYPLEQLSVDGIALLVSSGYGSTGAAVVGTAPQQDAFD